MINTNDMREWAQRRLKAALRVDTPFPWQCELLERFLEGRPPSAVDVPTGSERRR